MKIEQRLKPCPFCGNKARLVPQYSEDGFGAQHIFAYIVKCTGCGAIKKSYDSLKRTALAAWNRRH